MNTTKTLYGLYSKEYEEDGTVRELLHEISTEREDLEADVEFLNSLTSRIRFWTQEVGE